MCLQKLFFSNNIQSFSNHSIFISNLYSHISKDIIFILHNVCIYFFFYFSASINAYKSISLTDAIFGMTVTLIQFSVCDYRFLCIYMLKNMVRESYVPFRSINSPSPGDSAII